MKPVANNRKQATTLPPNRINELGIHSAMTVGEVHEILWSNQILTKSMVNGFLKCGIQTERRRVYGEKEPPGIAMGMGSNYHLLMDVWAKRVIERKAVPTQAEAMELLNDNWAKFLDGCEDPEAKDVVFRTEKIGRMLRAYELWTVMYGNDIMPKIGKPVATEVGYGYGGEIAVEDSHGTTIKIAGTLDLETEQGIGDYKFVGSTSQYRKANKFLYEAGHYSLLTGQRKVFLFPVVHNLKSGVKMEAVDVSQDDGTELTCVETLGRVRRTIDAGLFPAPAAPPGAFPCQPKFCGYFGTTCPRTKHLKREDFMPGGQFGPKKR